MRHRWTVSGFFLAIVLLAFVVSFGTYVASRVSVLPREPVSPVSIDTSLTDPPCWRWSEMYPPSAYNKCQELHKASGRR